MPAHDALNPPIHVVDDDVDLRDGLVWLLASRGLVARAWPSGEAFLQGLASGPQPPACSVVLLDIRMEPISGLATFERLKAQAWPWPVLFLTGHGDLAMAVAAVKNGAWDFLEKPFQDNLLVDKVAAARQAAIAQHEQAQERMLLQQALAALSAREREVLREVLRGHYNKNIADHLGITPRTVEFHRANIFEKLRVSSPVELAHRLGRLGLEPQD